MKVSSMVGVLVYVLEEMLVLCSARNSETYSIAYWDQWLEN